MKNDVYTSRSPHLDLHGETLSTVDYIVNAFINDNIKMNNKYIAIIHGWNSTIIRDHVHGLLRKNNSVKYFYIDINNIGQTIIELDIN